MNFLNKVQIIGNLTREPEIRKTSLGKFVCTLGVATNYAHFDKTTGEQRVLTEFHSVVCWDKLATICKQYLEKSSKVFFEGRIATRKWENKEGLQMFRTEIVADNLIILTKKKITESVSDNSNNDDLKSSLLDSKYNKETTFNSDDFGIDL